MSREEANRIVDALYDNWAHQSSDPAVTEQQVVDVLTAAIEETDAEDAIDTIRSSARKYGKKAAASRLAHARRIRYKVISALRTKVSDEVP